MYQRKEMEKAMPVCLGGQPAITISKPHEVWPPEPSQSEIDELCAQRKKDISIKGRTGIIKDLEELFMRFLDNEVKFAVTFNSGTSSLLAAYFAIGIGEGDEVIGPALTFHAALTPIFLLKGKLRLADIDTKTRCIDPNKIEALITQRTKAITVVHQWGHPADMDKIIPIARKYNLRIIEDCSHAHGSYYKGKVCGTFGDIAIFSFQAAKMIYAGEGGMLVTNNPYYHDRATLLGHYRDRSKEEIVDYILQRFWVTGYGQKLRMSPLNAVVAKHAISNFEKHKKGRHACLHYFNERLKEIDYLEPHYVSKDVDMGAWYGFKPLYKPEVLNNLSINRLIQLLNDEGMEISQASAPVLSTLPLLQATRNPLFLNNNDSMSLNDISQTPNAEFVHENCLSLPTFYEYEKDKKIIDQYICAFKKIRNNLNLILR